MDQDHAPKHTPQSEERRLTQREALMEHIKALQSVPEIEKDEVAINPKWTRSTKAESRLSFGSLSRCRIDRDTESALFELEASRLLDSLETPNLPLEAGTVIPLPDQVTHHQFLHLESLVRALLSSLAIVGLDDIAVLYGYQPNSKADREVVSCAGQRLKESRINIHALDYTQETLGGCYWTLTSLKATSVEPVNNILDTQAARYYALVDYTTTTVARLLVPKLKHDLVHEKNPFWRIMTLTVLAKVSAKMKVLSHHLSDFRLGLDDQEVQLEDIFNRRRAAPPARVLRVHSLSSGSSSGSSPNKHPPKWPQDSVSKEQGSHKNSYVSDMSEISALVFHILWRVLSDLKTRSTGDQNTNEFDISAIVYATGTQKTSAMLYQDAGIEVAGSQTGVALGICHRILDIVVETTHSIQQTTSMANDEPYHPGSGVMRPRLKITTNPKPAPASPIGTTLIVKSIAELVSIMVPLSCINPMVADKIFQTCSRVVAPDIIRRLHIRGRDFTGTISLCSGAETSLIALNADGGQSSSLSQAHFYLRQSRVEMTLDTMTQYEAPHWTRDTYSGRVPHRSHCHQSFDVTRGWAIEDTAVTVRCLNYTVPIMVGCGVLVTGGLLAGFLVGERITGVDPFNLTMFCWIIAGFIFLVAKSVRVVSWPWRDFLLGRVTTRSVSELASVTGMDGQSVILHLLSLEGKLPLFTRGPFNSVFTWKAEVDAGFSIDVQPTVGTLFASGMVVLEVLSSNGPALVCMDLRPEMNRFHPVYLRKMVHSQNKRVSALACVEPPREDEADKDIFFRNQKIRWERVIGVYNDENRRVR